MQQQGPPSTYAMQMSYQCQQSMRCTYESSRSFNQASAVPAGAGGLAFAGPSSATSPLPPVEKCIGQVMLDWEFLHDLDLHLLKVTETNVTSNRRGGKGAGRNGYLQVPEPGPEPMPEAPAANLELASLVDPATNTLRLQKSQKLEKVAFYGNKTVPARGSDIPQVVLELDRNAAVHSHKPVENLYLTETLESGVYVVTIHNYSQRQLMDNVVGPTSAHTYRKFDDFKKGDPGYQMMENALNKQIAHSNDEDGTPEKIALMTQIDQELQQGSHQVQQKCSSGSESHGVHYGVTIYTYPDRAALPAHAAPKHPQAASPEELEHQFKFDFFATSECVFNPDHASGYNGASVLAQTNTEDGKLALSNGKAAHVGLLKVVKPRGGKAKIVEVKVLAGIPRADGINAVDVHGESISVGGITAMSAHRMQHMGQPRTTNASLTVSRMPSIAEPLSEPQHQMQMPSIADVAGYLWRAPPQQQQVLPQQLQQQQRAFPLSSSSQAWEPQPEPTSTHQRMQQSQSLATGVSHRQPPQPQRVLSNSFQASTRQPSQSLVERRQPQNSSDNTAIVWPQAVSAAPLVRRLVRA